MARARTTVVLLSAALLAPGCTGLSERQRVWLAEGQRAFEQGQYDHAVQRLSRFLEQVRGRPETSIALYLRGMAYAKSGRRRAAYEDLRRCARMAAQPEVTWRANVVLGTLYFEDEQWDAAGRACGAAADAMPPAPPLDAVLFRIGLCYERTGRWAEARERYRQLLARFPASSYARDARRRIQLGADHFAVQCGAFSRPANADRLRAELAAKGLSAYVRREPRGDKAMYVVLVGRYASYADARRQLAAVRAQVPAAVLWP